MEEMEVEVIKIIQMKSRKRITLPKSAQELLKTKDNDHIAFLRIKDLPGIHIVKVVLDLNQKITVDKK